MVKAVIAQLESSAQSVLTNKKSGNDMLRTHCSGAKDTTVVAAKDCCHPSKACVYTAVEVVQLREERMMLDREKVAKATICQEQAAAKIV